MEAFQVRILPDPASFRKAWLRLSFRRPGSWIFFLLSLSLALVCLWDLIQGEATVWYLGILAPLPIGIQMLIGLKRSTDVLKANPHLLQKWDATFSITELQLTGAHFENHFRWTEMARIVEFPDQWIFFPEKDLPLVFDKDQFSPQQIEALQEVLQKIHEISGELPS